MINIKNHPFFILSNLNAYGSQLTNDTYSGNFKCLVKDKKVVGIFALTKAGNLIMQTGRAYDYTKIIIDECLEDTILLKGVVGAWELVQPIWDYAKKQLPSIKETLSGKKILFQLILDNVFWRPSKFEVRYLESLDCPVWEQLNKTYRQENNLDQREEEDARYKRFLQDVDNKYWYGLFIGKNLVYIACGISNIDNVIYWV